MLILGHLGIGLQLSKQFVKKEIFNQKKWLWLFFLGTLLPDIIDKPLYHVSALWQGKRGAELGLISCTRTFGHTVLFLLILFFLARSKKSIPLFLLAVGATSHIVIDYIGDTVGLGIFGNPFPRETHNGIPIEIVGLFWPLLGNKFQDFPLANALQHIDVSLRPHLLIGEILGIIFLYNNKIVRNWVYQWVDKLWKRAYSPFR